MALATSNGEGAVQVWDVERSEERARGPIALGGASIVVLSPDGKTLATGGPNCANGVRLWDTATGEELSHPCHYNAPESVAFSPDGQWVASGCRMWEEPAVRLWDASTGRQLRVFAGHERGVESAVFFPDGKRVVTAGRYSDGTVRIWDAQSGAESRRLEDAGRNLNAALSADGKVLVTGDGICNPGESCDIRIWEADSGKLLRRLKGPEEWVRSLTVTPDGRTVLLAGGGRIYAWDVASGRAHHWDRLERTGAWSLAVSPDGQALALAREKKPTQLIELATRRLIRELPSASYVAFSPDGRFLALAATSQGVEVVDRATGDKLLTLGAEGPPVRSLAFSPDGKRLATGAYDSLIHIWDVADLPALAGKAGKDPDADALTKAWADLIELDAAPADRAAWVLARGGGAAVRLLEGKLSPVEETEVKRIARLIVELDDDHFVVREMATAELGRVGVAAEDALLAALAGKLSKEAERRIEQLLDKTDRAEEPTEHLRTLRALAVLERIGAPEAKALLRKLADGADAGLTREAKRALERLARRP
jgi:WD40 repeat protein